MKVVGVESGDVLEHMVSVVPRYLVQVGNAWHARSHSSRCYYNHRCTAKTPPFWISFSLSRNHARALGQPIRDQLLANNSWIEEHSRAELLVLDVLLGPGIHDAKKDIDIPVASSSWRITSHGDCASGGSFQYVSVADIATLPARTATERNARGQAA